ncbi:MAG: MerR family transcriptional regulator [Thermodesulfobacteriota bacterium]
MVRPKAKTRKFLKISELADQAGVSPRTIHFYIQEGLLPPPEKTGRNMAYYDPACVNKIRAIKKAQTERFLPLVVIGRILRENGYDYSTLATRAPDREAPTPPPQPILLEHISGGALMEFKKRGWLGSDRPADWTEADRRFLGFFLRCLDLGLSQEKFRQVFETIQALIEEVVGTEFQAWGGKTAHDQDLSSLERRVVQEFMDQVRRRRLAAALRRHRRSLDNAAMAIGDEGYGLPGAAIADDLKAMEGQLKIRPADHRLLIDLATGYSCTGELDRSLALLRRVLRRDQDNVAARVRFCWYRRFSSRREGPLKWRDELIELLRLYPESIMGHIFLAVWLAGDALESNHHQDSQHLINSSLAELARAEKLPAGDLHEWALVRYSRGLITTYLLPFLGDLEPGVQALNEVLARRQALDQYYAQRMPFFPKWLWPNLLSLLGLADLKLGRFQPAAEAFRQALAFQVSGPFAEKVEAGLREAESSLKTEGRSQAGGRT